MQKSKLTVFLVISLAFNLTVLAVFMVHWFENGDERKTASYCDPHRCRTFARRFGLRPSSADRFAREMSRFRKDEDRLRAGITETRLDLMDLFHAAQPDSEKIEKKVEEISRLQGELEKIMVKRLLRVNSVLSDSEKVRFHRVLMHRMHHERQMHPPGI